MTKCVKMNDKKERREETMNNLSDLLAYEIAPLLKSVHFRVTGAESRGHANGPSSTPHHWTLFPSRGRSVQVFDRLLDPTTRAWETPRACRIHREFLYLAPFVFTPAIPRPAAASFVDAVSTVHEASPNTTAEWCLAATSTLPAIMRIRSVI